MPRGGTGRSEGAAQRTDLAWSRTGLAIAAIIVVVLRRLPHRPGALVILSLLGAGLAVWVIALWVARRASRDQQSLWPTLGPDALRLVTIGVVLFAIAAFALPFIPGT